MLLLRTSARSHTQVAMHSYVHTSQIVIKCVYIAEAGLKIVALGPEVPPIHRGLRNAIDYKLSQPCAVLQPQVLVACTPSMRRGVGTRSCKRGNETWKGVL